MRIKNSSKGVKTLFIVFYFIFSLLLAIEIYYITISIIHAPIIEHNFFDHFLYIHFLYLGTIGILGIYLSYFCYIKNKQLYYILVVWSLFIFGLSSSLIFLRWIQYPLIPVEEIPFRDFKFMNYWFSIFFEFSIIPLSILSSIGIIGMNKYLKFRKPIINVNKNLKYSNLIFPSILIFLTLSNSIVRGIYWNNRHNYYTDDDVQIIGWVTENIPSGSNIAFTKDRLKSLTSNGFYNMYPIDEEFRFALEAFNGIKTSYQYDNNCHINLIEELYGYKKVLEIFDGDKNGFVFIDIDLNSTQENGSIDFLIRTTNKSKSFYINFKSNEIIEGVSLQIKENRLRCYNGSNYQAITKMENNVWYQIKIDFECSNRSYMSLNKFRWKIAINGTDYGEYKFRNNITNIRYVKLYSNKEDSDWSVFLDAFNFSWIIDLNNFEEFIISLYKEIILDYFIVRDINYLLLQDHLILKLQLSEFQVFSF